MKLEPIIQSEVSQKEKHQYSILTHIYGTLKDGNNNPEYETAKETLMSQDRWLDLGCKWSFMGHPAMFCEFY